MKIKIEGVCSVPSLVGHPLGARRYVLRHLAHGVTHPRMPPMCRRVDLCRHRRPDATYFTVLIGTRKPPA